MAGTSVPASSFFPTLHSQQTLGMAYVSIPRLCRVVLVLLGCGLVMVRALAMHAIGGWRLDSRMCPFGIFGGRFWGVQFGPFEEKPLFHLELVIFTLTLPSPTHPTRLPLSLRLSNLANAKYE